MRRARGDLADPVRNWRAWRFPHLRAARTKPERAQDRAIAAAKANGKFAGCGGNRDVERQAAAVRRGALFVTTQTDIGFLMASANKWTQGIRDALAQ
jgi:hypothetical protein